MPVLLDQPSTGNARSSAAQHSSLSAVLNRLTYETACNLEGGSSNANAGCTYQQVLRGPVQIQEMQGLQAMFRGERGWEPGAKPYRKNTGGNKTSHARTGAQKVSGLSSLRQKRFNNQRSLADAI